MNKRLSILLWTLVAVNPMAHAQDPTTYRITGTLSGSFEDLMASPFSAPFQDGTVSLLDPASFDNAPFLLEMFSTSTPQQGSIADRPRSNPQTDWYVVDPLDTVRLYVPSSGLRQPIVFDKPMQLASIHLGPYEGSSPVTQIQLCAGGVGFASLGCTSEALRFSLPSDVFPTLWPPLAPVAAVGGVELSLPPLDAHVSLPTDLVEPDANGHILVVHQEVLRHQGVLSVVDASDVSFAVSPIPEPSTYVLMGVALSALFWGLWRRQRLFDECGGAAPA